MLTTLIDVMEFIFYHGRRYSIVHQMNSGHLEMNNTLKNMLILVRYIFGVVFQLDAFFLVITFSN